jgi:hypothetical protein
VATKLTSRRIDWANDNDEKCVQWAMWGFNYRTIAALTNRSVGQVGYRLKRAVVKTKDYRNGGGQIAKMVIAGKPFSSQSTVRSHLEKLGLRKT